MSALFDSAVLPFVGGEYRARVVRDTPDLTDADTVPLLLDLGVDVTASIQLRVRDLYCAERGTPAGDRAIIDARRLLPDGALVRVLLHRTRTDRERRTFVRYVGDVWRLASDSAPGVRAFMDYRLAMELLGHGGQGTGSKGGTPDA